LVINVAGDINCLVVEAKWVRSQLNHGI